MSAGNFENLLKLIESKPIINDRYTNVMRIGSDGKKGYHSLVFTAKDNKSRKGRLVVLKFLDPSFSRSKYKLDCFEREIELLTTLNKQRNILPLIEGKSELPIVMREPTTGIEVPFSLSFHVTPLARLNVRDYIVSNDNNYLRNLFYFREICKAVQRLHKQRICHRDLKPGNFLVMGKRYVCICDFGSARSFATGEASIKDYYDRPVGDTRYSAPELLCGLNFSPEHNFYGDIYSLGIILFELFTKIPLGPELFTFEERIEIIRDFRDVSERTRIEVVKGVIATIAESKKLPSVRLYNTAIPKNIAFQVDRIYQCMAALDYTKRETNFDRIFLLLEIAIKVTKHEIYCQQKEKIKKNKKKLP